ncbi:bifunctional serine/threonine-protein kinase/formylglycine-generating enzyme family protein [Urbifossiella limnaea]|uniref:non-specific serine/threonine protein kinase n=1 Tax=Urbifossiella limnaea TaxID=2528023 RepID=A0A517XWR1_9BACT|nr:bifunctional serine/threonine-protein kinase/formylglycine-generating enzyme family protein [Urbifossiella limnaea]QDU21949.1 Serine/threonine-protein kinase PrkC [Urbifossiella limnaea]
MPTDPKRVKEVFLAAAELPEGAARSAFLDRSCGGDADLRGRVEVLLRSHDPEGSFLGTPAAVVPDPDAAATRAFEPDPDHAATRTGGGGAADDDEVPLGFLAPATRPDSLGRIGHYEVLQVLGHGGFGIVFRAFDDVLHRVVAVKVLAPQMASTSPARKRFLREARSSAQVRHENVVQVYEVGETPLPYIAMEFIPGETLQDRLNRIGPVEPAEVVRIGRQIAEGLAAAHGQDLIHRDIKPGNVLLEGGAGRVKITDFGLARAADDASISQSGIIAGTPMYMAPEQAKGDKLDQRADLFSLGSVLYQMAAGRPPFRANSTVAVLKRVAEDTPRDIREIVPEVPQWLCDIIAKLHAKNPDDRYQSAREVADVLADCEAQLKANSKLKDFSRIPRSKQTKTAKTGNWKWVVAAAVLLLPVLAVAVTEFAGVTHLFRHQAMPNPNKGGHEPEVVTTTGWHGWPADAPQPAIAPFDATQARAHQDAWAKHLGVPVEYTNSLGMKFMLIPPGEFTMGSTAEEIAAALKDVSPDDKHWQECIQSEAPQHKVILTQPIYLGVNEVTQAEYEKVMGVNPSHFAPLGMGKEAVAGLETAEHSVETVSWNDAAEFCAKLSKQEKLKPFYFRAGETITPLDGTGYRLPSEAEWEFACRAGTATKYWIGDKDEDLVRAGWFGGNSGGRTHAAGELKANPFGLSDIHGNVWEWVQDGWDASYYGQFQDKPAINPNSPFSAGSLRVIRGGHWGYTASVCRSSHRHAIDPTDRGYLVGFRVSLPVDAVKAARQFKNTLGMEFVKVPKGKSWLGGGKDKLADKEVEIPADFYLGKYEVTQEEWEKVMGENPSHFSRAGYGKDAVKDIPDADLKRFPVENVSWDQCQIFVAKLNKLEKETGWVYRLPTEVEWEYACRGGPMA